MNNQDMLLALAALGSAFLTALALLSLIALVLGIDRVIRWAHDRRVIRGKLDRQLRQRLAEFASRQQF